MLESLGTRASETSGSRFMVRPCDAKHVFAVPTWRAGGLSKWVVGRVISTLKGTLIGVMVLIAL